MGNGKGVSDPKQAVMKYMQNNNNPMVQMLINQIILVCCIRLDKQDYEL